MAFQSVVKPTQALGIPGQISKGFHSYCNTIQAIVADDNVKAGAFVQTKADGTNEDEVVSVGANPTGKVLGVVVRDRLVNNEGTTETYPKGSTITVVTEGSVFIQGSQDAKRGYYVHIAKASGAVQFMGSINPNELYVGWKVEKSQPLADGNYLIEITTAGVN